MIAERKSFADIVPGNLIRCVAIFRKGVLVIATSIDHDSDNTVTLLILGRKHIRRVTMKLEWDVYVIV